MPHSDPPSEAYLAIWTFETGKTMITLSSKTTYERWLADPDQYAEKRIIRWNHQSRKDSSVRHLMGRYAVQFRMERYVRQPSPGAARYVVNT